MSPLIGLTLAVFTHVAVADVMPSDKRGVAYSWSVDNVAEYPEHALLIYPTSNHGFAYVYDPEVALTRMLRRDDWKGPPSALYAMELDALSAHAPDAPRHPHGDNGGRVMVVPRPPSPPTALMASLAVPPPGLVELDSPVRAVERTFHIDALTDEAFSISLVSEIAVHEDGSRHDRTAQVQAVDAVAADPKVGVAPVLTVGPAPVLTVGPEPAVVEQRRCGGCTTRGGASMGAAWLLLAAWVSLRLRGRR